MKFQIICDSAADLPDQVAKENEIKVVPFYVSLDGKTYLREGKDISVQDFHAAMRDHADCYPKTSMPTIGDYADAMRPLAEKGMPILCICLTQQFSGSFGAAINARKLLLDEFPDAKIHVMDSKLVTALEGLFVKEAVRLRDLELPLEKAVSLLESIRETGQIFFTTKDLKYLQHGGRLGKMACIAGNVLQLKPVLRFRNGALDNVQVCRGQKKAAQKVIENFFKFLKETGMNLKGYWFGTGIGLDVPEYEAFKETVQKVFDQLNIHPDDWVKVHIGATIGVHTGPYPMGLGILKKCEV